MMDKAHKQTDEKLEAMEKHLTSIYQRADKEIQETANKYFDRFKELDKKKLALVEKGELSETEYKTWRKNKMLYGKRYDQMREDVANQLLNVNRTAAAYVNGELPEVYSLNYNALEESVDGVGGYSFTLTDAGTVKNLATEDKTLLPYKYVDGKKDVRWNTKKVNSEVLQGILQGDSIPKIAKRLGNVTEMNRTSAIRNARTTVTSAECKGRQDSYLQAEKDGIILKREWVATEDGRTRHWHRELDGKTAKTNEPFENAIGKIMYPGDPTADGANVYNCRCTTIAKVEGFKKLQVEKAMEKPKEEWEERKERLMEVAPYRYHATTAPSLIGIYAEGLKPNRGMFGKGVYFAPSEEGAKEWTESSTGGKTVLRVSVDYLARNTDYDDFDNTQGLTKKKIPRKYIEIKNKSGVWEPLSEYAKRYRRSFGI